MNLVRPVMTVRVIAPVASHAPSSAHASTAKRIEFGAPDDSVLPPSVSS